MRTQRMGDAFPSRKDAEGHRLCAFCGALLKPGLLRWCRWQCQEDAYALTRPADATARVRTRDKGICADCGLDAEALRYAMGQLGLREHYLPYFRGPRKDLLQEIWKRGFNPGQRMWEMHHVTPVAEGGTYDLSNLVTLCVPCHKARHRSRLERSDDE